MIDLRDMEMLLALARHRHFARAASACGISQPAFSMRIRNLEETMNVPIVRRSRRFEGFTEEGEIILRWARRMLEDARTMGQEIQSVRDMVVGRLNIGTIPTALYYAARLPVRLSKNHPGIVVRTHSATSLQVQQGIDDGTLDVGITYEDGVDTDLMVVRPLYTERYVLVAPDGMIASPKDQIAWADIAEVPLSLLGPQMQNRRILDGLFLDAGIRPNIVAENNTFSASIVLVREGFAATILPESFIGSVDFGTKAKPFALIKPQAEKSIALVHARRSPLLPTLQALLDFVDKENLSIKRKS